MIYLLIGISAEAWAQRARRGMSDSGIGGSSIKCVHKQMHFIEQMFGDVSQTAKDTRRLR